MKNNTFIRSALTATAIASATLFGPITTHQTAASQANPLVPASATEAIEVAVGETVAITVTIDNLSPDQGTILTPLWVGFHEGSYDLYEPGLPASEGLESIAEDGSPMILSETFNSGGTGRIDGVITGDGISPDSPPLIGPNSSATLTFNVDPSNPYFSFASMILPSNDGFIGNESGTAHRLFDANGAFIGADFVVIGGQIQDAGTEVNDELAENVPVLGQAAPDTGTDENGVVSDHEGFITDGTVLSAFPNAAFDQGLYPVARIRVELAQ